MIDEQWAALFAELRALAKAGVPLDAGMRAFANDAGGKLGVQAGRIADALAAGEPLHDALTALGCRSAPAYAAIVEAGVRTGDLPRALEAAIETSATAAELKRRLTLALVYPATVAILASFLLFILATVFAPAAAAFTRQSPLGDRHWPLFLDSLGAIGPAFLCLTGLLLLAILLMVAGVVPLGLFRWMRDIRRWPEYASLSRFTQLLGMLIEHRTPMPAALRLAAQATGDSAAQRAASALATGLETGATPSAAQLVGLPASLCLLLAGSQDAVQLAASLRRMAAEYRDRIDDILFAARTQLPAVCLVGIAGTAVLIYGLIEFLPLAGILKGIGRAV